MRLALLLAGIGLVAASAPGHATPVSLRGPSPYGVVKLGDRVEVDLGGGCASARTVVRAVVRSRVVHGPTGKGCHPVLTVPDARTLARAGWGEGDPLRLEVVSGRSRVPLTYSRLEPATAKVAAGAPTVVPRVSDPLGGRSGLAMRTGDVVDLGAVDLTNLQSVNVRNLTAGTGVWELTVGSATGRVVASGQLGSSGSLASAGDAGWFHSVAPLAFRPATQVVGDENTLADLTPAVGQAPRVFLALRALVDNAPAVVNWVDLNGPGVALPHTFASERGFEVLFDGSSFDGWSHVGPGRFVLEDGAMRAEHDPQDRGWAWLWWTHAQFSDFALRLRFKVETWEDNGGILLRHVDPQGDPNRSTQSADEVQIQEGFENHTGGIAHEADATRLATGMVGQWNDLEIVAVGKVYVVRINGHEVRRYVSKKPVRGFIAVENEQLFGTNGGHLWYDDIRVHRCTTGDHLCGGAR